jgi:hypothetical protein
MIPDRAKSEQLGPGLLELGLPGINPTYVQQMDSVAHIAEMPQVGRVVTVQKIKGLHLSGFPA